MVFSSVMSTLLVDAPLGRSGRCVLDIVEMLVEMVLLSAQGTDLA